MYKKSFLIPYYLNVNISYEILQYSKKFSVLAIISNYLSI